MTYRTQKRPHRRRAQERVLFDLARNKGFVEMGGSGWRKQRSDSPLVNTYRNWCDARAIAAIFLHKGREIDELVLDLSPLRTPGAFEDAAAFCLAQPEALGGRLEALQESALEAAAAAAASDNDVREDAEADSAAGSVEVAAQARAGDEQGEALCADEERADPMASARGIVDARADDFRSLPIHRLPMYIVSWERPRPEAKALAKSLASLLGTAVQKKGRSKTLGGPKVKPGKSRRHGGYGIG